MFIALFTVANHTLGPHLCDRIRNAFRAMDTFRHSASRAPARTETNSYMRASVEDTFLKELSICLYFSSDDLGPA
jgi:hypothetical protein